MLSDTTRRTFLKVSALGLATSATARGEKPLQGAPTGPKGSLASWITDSQRKCARGPESRWTAGSAAGKGIVLDPDKKFQSMLGFGGAFTDGACYTFNRLAAPVREELFHEMFHPSAMGLSVCRVCMGSSDYSTKLYSYDDGEVDLDLTRFSVEHDRQYILPIVREARKVNPDIFLLATPWSPPGWMKSNGTMLGGSMRRKYIPNYAQYFVKFLQAYQSEGVPVQAVTAQNEVDTDQDGRMPACIFPQEYEIEFVKQLGHLLRKDGMQTKIWILDHNYNLWGRATCELEDPGVREYCGDVAWHGYYGTPDMVSKVHAEHPEVAMHWTEGGPDYTNADYLTDWAKWGSTFTAAMRNWCDSITAWNLSLDENGKPNIGPFPCGGVVSIHSQTKEITRSGQFWALAQFSRFIRRGGKRFDSLGTIEKVDHVAVENPDGKRILVLSNAGAATSVTIEMSGMTADVPLTADSITTVVWET